MSTGIFKDSGGFDLSYTFDSPPLSPAILTILVHGLGDHSQSTPYRSLSEFLVAHGSAVFRYDLRGHGNSAGRRGHVDYFEQFRNGLKLAIEKAKSLSSTSKVYLIGASLGGLISIDYVLNDDGLVDGVIAIAPALSSSGAPKIVRVLVPIISRILPKTVIDPGLDLDSISRDKAAVARYIEDPLFSTKLTLKAAAEITKAVDCVNLQASRFSLPILILHGTADKIVPPESSKIFLETVKTNDKTRILYAEARHNLLLETNREVVFADIIGWIHDRSNRTSSR